MPTTEGHEMTDFQIKAALAAELDDAEPRRDLWPLIEAEALRRQTNPRWCVKLQALLDRLGVRARGLKSRLRWLWPNSDWSPKPGWSWATFDSAPRIAGGIAVLRRPRLTIGSAAVLAAALAMLMVFLPRPGDPVVFARHAGGYWYNAGEYDTFFKSEGVNPAVDTTHNNFCRFGLDVDTQPYTAAWQLVMDGRLPDPDSVRVEEFINYFDQGFEPPADDPFAVQIEGAPSPFGGEGHWLIRVGLQGRFTDAGESPVIARNVEAPVEFNPDVVSSYRQLGYEYRRFAENDSPNDAMVAGEVRAGLTVTALYELKFHEGAVGRVATVHVKYDDPDTGARGPELTREIHRSEFSVALEQASPRFQRDAAVAEYAEILRESYWAQDGSLQDVRMLAQRVRTLLPDAPDVAEFADLVSRAEMIDPRSNM